jgi:prepilin-type N-terminal cleavage/methylation domain-containing protein
MSKGFTLIEVLVVITITAILSTLVLAFNYGLKIHKDLDLAINSLAAVVRDSQQKSITQEETKKWGVYLRVKNNQSTYSLFKDSTSNILATYIVPDPLKFDTTSGWNDLPPGTCPNDCYREFYFTQVDGLPYPLVGSNVIIKLQINGDTDSARSITVSNNGTVSY